MDPPPVGYPIRSALGSFRQEGRDSHVVIMDTGWILFARNDPHCERYDDHWRSWCVAYFELSHAAEFAPVHSPIRKPTTACVIGDA